MNSYVLGMDGGATKTQCALFDIEGNQIDIINWGPTNHEILKSGFRELKRELTLLSNYLMKRNNITLDQIRKSVFGMAGVDTIVQHKIVSGIISETGFKDFLLCNDAYLGIKAGCRDGYGICIANGTGCCVAGIDAGGRMLQVGGQGYLTGDLGGGAVLGELAVSSAYRYFFKCGEYTRMADLLFEELNITSKYSFMDQLMQKLNDEEVRIQDLNRVVFEAANLGDKVAVNILKEIGRGLSTSVNGILRELEFNGGQVNIVLSGSINLKGNNPALIDTLKRNVILKNKDKKIRFLKLNKPPVLGAVKWAFEIAGIGTVPDCGL